MLAHRDLFMSSVTAPDWNISSVMPPSMQIDGMPAAIALKLAGRVQHAGRREQDVEVGLHHRFAHRGRRIVVVGRAAIEQREGRVGADVGEDGHHRLPDARVVIEIRQHEDALALA